MDTSDQKKLENCVICLEYMSEQLEFLPCSHSFHSECIRTWLEQKSICPLCKISVNIEVDYENPENIRDQHDEDYDYSSFSYLVGSLAYGLDSEELWSRTQFPRIRQTFALPATEFQPEWGSHIVDPPSQHTFIEYQPERLTYELEPARENIPRHISLGGLSGIRISETMLARRNPNHSALNILEQFMSPAVRDAINSIPDNEDNERLRTTMSIIFGLAGACQMISAGRHNRSGDLD